MDIDIARKDEIPQEFTSEQIANIKANMPTQTANVNIVPYHIYDEDEHVVGEWRQTIDGVKKKKSVYERSVFAQNVYLGVNDGNSALLHGIENIDFGFVHEAYIDFENGWQVANSVSINNQKYVISLSVGSNSIYNASQVDFDASNSRKYKAIIRYTKSTDEWEVVG